MSSNPCRFIFSSLESEEHRERLTRAFQIIDTVPLDAKWVSIEDKGRYMRYRTTMDDVIVILSFMKPVSGIDPMLVRINIETHDFEVDLRIPTEEMLTSNDPGEALAPIRGDYALASAEACSALTDSAPNAALANSPVDSLSALVSMALMTHGESRTVIDRYSDGKGASRLDAFIMGMPEGLSIDVLDKGEIEHSLMPPGVAALPRLGRLVLIGGRGPGMTCAIMNFRQPLVLLENPDAMSAMAAHSDLLRIANLLQNG